MPGAVYVASVRDPASRCLSAYYHDLGRHNLEDDLESKLSWMSRCGRDAQTQYLRTVDSQSVPDVFSSYDVVVVVERFDESLVAFRGRLNASLVDMLYLKSKASGNEPTGRDDRRQTQPGRTYPAHPPLEQEPALVRRLASTWEHSADAELVRLAIAALDRQVARLGSTFKTELTLFQSMLSEVERECRNRFFEDCLWNDNGCGQACIDELAIARHWIT